MRSFISVTLFLLISSCVWHEQVGRAIVDNSNQGRTSVPQNVDVNVQDFNLVNNRITEINSLSFVRYTRMRIVRLDKNPLRKIGENTFAQNVHLWKFYCVDCNIERLPADFGSCVPYLEIMHLKRGINSGVATTLFRYPYFEAFTSLRLIALAYLPLENAEIIKLPRSLRTWIMPNTGLTAFPNLTSALYPLLRQIGIAENPQIKLIPDNIWEHISDNLQRFNADDTGLITVVDFTLKKNLRSIVITNNHLETVPDLLNMPSLTELMIAYNSRMSCDRRLCWRRFWDRMRTPLAVSDDVICVQPSELAGYKLSEVNPKLMGCVEGIVRLSTFGTWYYWLWYPPLQWSWKGGGGGVGSRLSDLCPSVRLWTESYSVSSTILAGSISYLHMLSTKFRRCVAW